ncbi:MAG: triose-phosphate isomerase [Acidobacteriota bacterium]
MRRPVIAGNWKMYKTIGETVQFIEQLKPLVKDSNHCDIVLAPSLVALSAAAKAATGSKIAISSQDVFWEQEGAFTGEISANMLADAGCQYTIIGHSERRQYFGETNETVNKKVQSALKASLTPIVCVGEVLAEREADQTHSVIKSQFDEGFAGLTADAFSHIIIAYEPVWAIGTGRTATPEMAVEVHQLIRELASQAFGPGSGKAVRILYGGSVKPDNIKGLMAQTDIDGALVGGASLKVDSFVSIVNF